MSHREYLPDSIASILDAISKRDPRWDRQEKLEKLLVEFKADPEEAADLLPALLYGLLQDEEIRTYSKALRESLERYDQRQIGEVDECDLHHDWKAREEGMP